jgi:uncharacterized SAM-binding protein YcdF (DUF218 family)
MTTLTFRGTTLRWRTLAALAGSAIAAAFVLSFGWFIYLAGAFAEPPPHADGIVAFTGGQERVETALRLLAQGRAERLLLSGIGGGAELPELARLAGVNPLPIATRVSIGRSATTTRGNALETAAWARTNGIRSLLVVTAFYHMPRAMLELRRLLPDTTLYPVPVWPPATQRWSAPTLRLIAEEYIKYLASAVGLTTVLPVREPIAAHGGHGG